jgi:hypothetical protein
MGHQLVIEQKFLPAYIKFSRQLRVIARSRADGIVIWADQLQTALILKQLRAAGMKQPVFGSYRTISADMLAAAGDAAEGFEAVFPYDPSRNDPEWISFNQRFEARFHEPTEAFSALAYDAMNALLDSICKAGLNRARIHDALASITEYRGVTGAMRFDVNQKNVSPMYLASVHGGKISYQLMPMEREPAETKQSVATPSPAPVSPAGASSLSNSAPEVKKTVLNAYARIGEDPVEFNGPRGKAVPSSTVILFGPGAAQTAAENQQPEIQLVAVDSAQPWGKASAELVNTISSAKPLAIVALDRGRAHLALQFALKFFVPVLALTPDKTLTSINVPWIFRQPADATAASTLRLIADARQQGGTAAIALRDLLASGKPIDGEAFATTGEPLQQ